MAETALFALVAVLFAIGLLAWIPAHRTRTAATSAAYACAQFLSQSANPENAASRAHEVAYQTLDADWSSTFGARYMVEVSPPQGPGQPGVCAVHYLTPQLFPFFGSSSWSIAWYASRSETWKAKWLP